MLTQKREIGEVQEWSPGANKLYLLTPYLTQSNTLLTVARICIKPIEKISLMREIKNRDSLKNDVECTQSNIRVKSNAIHFCAVKQKRTRSCKMIKEKSTCSICRE